MDKDRIQRLNKQHKRYLKHEEKRRTPEEQRELKRRGGLRKAGRERTRRWRADDADPDEVAGTERMRRARPAAERRAPQDEPAARGTLSRPDPQDPRRELVIATGLDLAVLVVSQHTPPLRRGLIDRFLVAVGRGGIAPLLCINKIDLSSDEDRRQLDRELTPYADVGVPQVRCSAHTGEGLDALRTAVRGTTCAFVGHSGVGKSSLLNALDPTGARRTGDVRASDGRGRHTTTRSSVTALDDGTRIVDTPGVRSFGLWDMDRASLRWYFPEFEHAGCRFADCAHVHEPGCGVRSGVESGAIAPARFASYLRMYESLDE